MALYFCSLLVFRGSYIVCRYGRGNKSSVLDEQDQSLHLLSDNSQYDSTSLRKVTLGDVYYSDM